jgi:rhodanese-related sulfurtransferase
MTGSVLYRPQVTTAGDQRQEHLVDDLGQELVSNGPAGDHHFMAQEDPGPRCRQLTPLPSGPTKRHLGQQTGFGYDPGMASGAEAAGEVGPEEADGLIRGGSFLLDVREDYEWDAGHVSSAVHIPLGLLADHIGELPSDRQVVVVCRSGVRSARAAAFLNASGYDAVNLAGGMQAWAAVDLPFVSADGAPGEVA